MPSSYKVSIEKLQDLADQLAGLVDEGAKIFVKAGGETVGDIEHAGETAHLDKVEKAAGELWIESLPYAA